MGIDKSPLAGASVADSGSILRSNASMPSADADTSRRSVPETKETTGSVFLFFFLLQHHLALRQAGSEVHLGDFLMHQVLMAIDAGGALRFHLLVRSLSRHARRLCILVASPAGGAVPPLQFHARPVGCLRPSLVEFLDSRVVVGELIYQERQSIHHMRPYRLVEVGQPLGDVAILAARIGAERAPVRGFFQLLIRVSLGMAAHAELGP